MDLKSWSMLGLLDAELISKIKIAFVFGISGSEAIIVTKEDEVFSFGSNESGCLGRGEALPTLTPTKVEELCNKRIKGFAFGNGPFVVALTENGEVYSWGRNNFGQLGNNANDGNISTPNKIGDPLLNKHVIEIACGGSHTLALTDEGEVYFWGEDCVKFLQYLQRSFQNFFSPTSRGDHRHVYDVPEFEILHDGFSEIPEVSFQLSPKRVNFVSQMKKVTAIACGYETSMALLESGELYGWGCNDQGQLGLGSSEDYHLNPSQISSLKDVLITKVACGYAHTLAISDNGELFAWGGNTYGQLGTGGTCPAKEPVCITSGMGRVLDIAALHNSNISAAVTENSEVYMWGQCRGMTIVKPTKTYFTSVNDVFAWCVNVTPTSVRIVESAGLTVADSMKKAFDDPTNSDLKVMVDGKPIHVHKAFLKIRSSHMQIALHERWQEESTEIFEVKDVSYKAYRSFLEYLYTDEVKVSLGDALELLDLANSYLEEGLKEKCVAIIKRGLTVENVAFVYDTVLKYDNKELEESCLKFSVYHMAAITNTETFRNLSIESRMQFILRGGEFGAFKE